MNTNRSARLFQRAQQILPGGVDSPVRAFKTVGASPLFIRRASGARIEDVDGNRYIDYVMSWGPLIHGHAPRGLSRRSAAAAQDGTSFGAPSPLEVELGERVRALMPSIERVRFVSSGTEAAMSAVRVARAATGRDRIVKFEGCYHGHADAFLVQGRIRRADARHADQPRRHRAARRPTRCVARYNDLDSVRRAVRRAPRSDRRASSSSRSPATWASCRRPTASSRGLREICSRARRAADLRRGDLRISRRGRRRAGAVRRRARI